MTEGINPKDILGMKKVSMSKVPATAIIQCARAMMDGARKYGPFNWRKHPVKAHVYVDAAKRHLDAWFEREEESKDAKVHHLGHAMACLAILIDAQETDCLDDDRPENSAGVSGMLDRYTEET
jgi:hypothetical protein